MRNSCKIVVLASAAILTLTAPGCSSMQGQPYGLSGGPNMQSSRGVLIREEEDRRLTSSYTNWRPATTVLPSYR